MACIIVKVERSSALECTYLSKCVLWNFTAVFVIRVYFYCGQDLSRFWGNDSRDSLIRVANKNTSRRDLRAQNSEMLV